MLETGIEPQPQPKIPLTRTGTYSAFRFRAVIDWIELRLVTEKASNFDTLRKRMEVPYVQAVDKGPGSAATEFLVKIQEPTSWNDVEQRIVKFTWDHPLAEPVSVTGIEVALDVYSRSQDREQLVDMVTRLYRNSTKLISQNRRLARHRHETQSIASHRSLRRKIAEGFNLYIGNAKDEARQHLYLKGTDSLDGKVIHLEPESCRARTEFTLRGKALPCQSLEEWKRHEFTDMADFFKYRTMKTCVDPLMKHALMHVDQIGERRPRPTKDRRPRFFFKSTKADTELNALAYSALRELTKRMKS